MYCVTLLTNFVSFLFVRRDGFAYDIAHAKYHLYRIDLLLAMRQFRTASVHKMDLYCQWPSQQVRYSSTHVA